MESPNIEDAHSKIVLHTLIEIVNLVTGVCCSPIVSLEEVRVYVTPLKDILCNIL